MAMYKDKSSNSKAGSDKISSLKKHKNINCENVYKATASLSETKMETPTKPKSSKSLSSNICDLSQDNNNNYKTTTGPKDIGIYGDLNKNKGQNHLNIDTNINKALKALRSPRLSISQSNEK